MDKNGLMQRAVEPQNSSELLANFKRAFGPQARTPVSLDAQLASLSDKELQLLYSTASYVKLAHSFKRENSQPYTELVQQMYPRLSTKIRTLVAALLQEAEPVVPQATREVPVPDVELREQVLSEYEAILLGADTRTTTQPTATPSVGSDEVMNRTEQLQPKTQRMKGKMTFLRP